jgi:hypothetical protein
LALISLGKALMQAGRYARHFNSIPHIVNLLKTKRNLLYISNQSIPRCEHLPPWL